MFIRKLKDNIIEKIYIFALKIYKLKVVLNKNLCNKYLKYIYI